MLAQSIGDSLKQHIGTTHSPFVIKQQPENVQSWFKG